MPNDLIVEAKNDIKKGSKSFALASFFFSKKQKEAAWILYAWCRYCDDVIDHAKDLAEAQLKLNSLIIETEKCYAGTPSAVHPWIGLSQIVREYQIPKKYPMDLLRGFQIDASGVGIKTKDQLLDYCYCVAGTVGLMMCHIMGVSHNQALRHAVDLGTAMQLTNIARDVKDDYQIGRIYIPDDWLTDAQLSRESFFRPENRTKLKITVDRLLSEASQLYLQGLAGLRFLSLRSAWAVGIALYVYRDIGRAVKAGASLDFEKRVVISKPRKIFLLLCSSLKILSLIPIRIAKPWKPSDSLNTWSAS